MEHLYGWYSQSMRPTDGKEASEVALDPIICQREECWCCSGNGSANLRIITQCFFRSRIFLCRLFNISADSIIHYCGATGELFICIAPDQQLLVVQRIRKMRVKGKQVNVEIGLWTQEMSPPFSIAGGMLSKKLLAQTQTSFGTEAMMIITDESVFTAKFRDATSLRWSAPNKSVPRQWKAHLEQLQSWGVLVVASISVLVWMLVSYFAVLKDSTTSRAIFSGRRFSAAFRPPPPINLGEIPEILREIQRIVSALPSGRKFTPRVVISDLRHWFHQIRLSQSLWKYFTIQAQNCVYYWTTVPMGWSYSPYIAQSMAWSIFLSGKIPPCLRLSFEEVRNEKIPPRFLYLRNNRGEIVGLIWLWIDNVTIFSMDEDVTHEITEHYFSNCVAYRIHVKNLSVHNPMDEDVTFLGVDFRMRSEDGKLVIQWRLDTSGIASWKERTQELVEGRDRRYYASFLGFISWDQYVRARPLILIRDLIALMSINAPKSYTDWSQPSPLTAADIDLIRQRMDLVLINQWSAVTEGVEGCQKDIYGK
jgi:hypothetical protein